MITITPCEQEALEYLFEFESAKMAADKRCVSLHTQKNQIKSVMSKWGVNTQIGLIKEFLLQFKGIEFNLNDFRQVSATCLLILFLYSLGNMDQITRRSRRLRRKYDTENVIYL